MDTTVMLVKNMFTNEQVIYDASKIFEVDTKKHKLSPFFGEIENQSKIYVYDAGHQLQRVAIYTTFQSREAFDEEVSKSEAEGSAKRYTLPALLKERTSKVFDKTKFIFEAEKEKANDVQMGVKRAAAKVDATRQQGLLKSSSNVNKRQKTEEAKQEKNPNKRGKIRERKLKAAETAPADPKKKESKSSKKTKKVDDDVEDFLPDPHNTDKDIDSEEKSEAGKSEQPTSVGQKNLELTSEPSAAVMGRKDEQMDLDQLDSNKSDATKPNKTSVPSNRKKDLLAAAGSSVESPVVSCISNCVPPKPSTSHNQEEFYECTNDICRSQFQALEDHYNQLEAELREEIKRLTKSQTQFDEMQSTMDSCHSMIMALKNEEERKRCPLESIKLAVKEADAEGIEVPDGLVYIGGGKFLEKKEVAKAEHETSFKTRMSALLQLILGPDLGAYGLSTSNDKIAIHQYQLDSLYALLNTMKWTKKCPLPQNFNKDYVRRQAGKICSEASAGKNKPCAAPDNGLALHELIRKRKSQEDVGSRREDED